MSLAFFSLRSENRLLPFLRLSSTTYLSREGATFLTFWSRKRITLSSSADVEERRRGGRENKKERTQDKVGWKETDGDSIFLLCVFSGFVFPFSSCLCFCTSFLPFWRRRKFHFIGCFSPVNPTPHTHNVCEAQEMRAYAVNFEEEDVQKSSSLQTE